MKKKLFLIIVFLLLFSQSIFSQQTDQTVKIKELEAKLDLYNIFYNEQKDFIGKQSKAAIEDINNQFTALKQENNLGIIISFIIGGMSALAVVIGLITIFKTSKKYAEKKIKEKFDHIIAENESEIIKIIKKESFEEKIKNEMKIVILSDEEKNYRDEVDHFLRKYGFIKKEFLSINTSLKGSDADLIILNDYICKIEKETPEKIETLLKERHPGLPVIQLINGPSKIKILPDNCGRSNSLTTLYPRIVELLMYREKMLSGY